MQQLQVEDTSSPGLLGGLLDLARGGVDIYRNVTAPDPATNPQVSATSPGGSQWYRSPLVIVGGVVLLVVGVILAIRK